VRPLRPNRGPKICLPAIHRKHKRPWVTHVPTAQSYGSIGFSAVRGLEAERETKEKAVGSWRGAHGLLVTLRNQRSESAHRPRWREITPDIASQGWKTATLILAMWRTTPFFQDLRGGVYTSPRAIVNPCNLKRSALKQIPVDYWQEVTTGQQGGDGRVIRERTRQWWRSHPEIRYGGAGGVDDRVWPSLAGEPVYLHGR